MIQNTFLFLDKLGNKTQDKISSMGINDWDSFLNAKNISGISKKRKLYYDIEISKARKELYKSNSLYFKKILPQSEYWRLYDFFKDETVFLDIETSGLSNNAEITLFGIFDGLNTKIMIQGINLDYNFLKKELSKYRLIATFNGNCFDLPFIKKRYPDLLPNIPSFDIRIITNRLGLKGGLKDVEKKIGIQRNRIIENFSGGDALRLWKIYKATSDDYYLKLLLEYNEEDIINLKKIADYCVEKMKAQIKN